MQDGSLEDIGEFLATKRLAIVGASRDPKHFSRGLFREFLAKGYDVVPVNPQATEIEGRRCFARVADITPPVEAALLITPAATTDEALRECSEAAIKRIWIYQAGRDEEVHEHAVGACRAQGSTVIEGYCPFMFLPKPVFFHRVHRFFMKVAGSYPL
jgi:predicted CoA-binding protein